MQNRLIRGCNLEGLVARNSGAQGQGFRGRMREALGLRSTVSTSETCEL